MFIIPGVGLEIELPVIQGAAIGRLHKLARSGAEYNVRVSELGMIGVRIETTEEHLTAPIT